MWRAFAVIAIFLGSLNAGQAAVGGANEEASRVALVVGVGAYETQPKIKNPTNDASFVAGALEAAGFRSVTVVTDPDKSGLEAALADFALLSEKSDIAVIYFAGRGYFLDGEQLLVATDAVVPSADAKSNKTGTVTVDRMIDSARHARRLAMVVIDACRNDPRQSPEHPAESRGISTASPQGASGGAKSPPLKELAALAPSVIGDLSMTDNLVVFYSVPAGKVALDGTGEADRYSPFALSFARHVAERRDDVLEFVRAVRDDVREATSGREIPVAEVSMSRDAITLAPPR